MNKVVNVVDNFFNSVFGWVFEYSFSEELLSVSTNKFIRRLAIITFPFSWILYYSVKIAVLFSFFVIGLAVALLLSPRDIYEVAKKYW